MAELGCKVAQDSQTNKPLNNEAKRDPKYCKYFQIVNVCALKNEA